MTSSQKVIKNIALSFAALLIFVIFSAIFGALYGIGEVLSKDIDIDDDLMSSIFCENCNNINYLNINVRYSDIEIIPGDNLLAVSNDKNVICKQDGNRLVVNEKRTSIFASRKNNTLKVYVPENILFDEVNINTGAGKLYAENIKTSRLKLDLGAGDASIKYIDASKADIDTGAGRFVIKNGNVENLDFDMGAGSTELTLKLTGDNKISTGVGKLDLRLIGTKEDYKIEANKGIGQILIDNVPVAANLIVGNGKTNIDLDGGIGEIIVNYIK